MANMWTDEEFARDVERKKKMPDTDKGKREKGYATKRATMKAEKREKGKDTPRDKIKTKPRQKGVVTARVRGKATSRHQENSY
jgi:hypothetical protein